MLNDFNQDKSGQNIDPLAEEPSFPMGKKIGLLLLGLALIGLFVFFTSDSWSSNTSTAVANDIQAQIEQINQRITELEEQLKTKQPSLPTPTIQQPEPTSTAEPTDALQSLIEQELRETVAQQAPQPIKEETAPAPKKSTKAESAPQTYTVKKGDTLSKISLHFYGTTKKWKKIVDANKEHLGHNQMLKTGMVLLIPKEAS